MTLKHLWLYFAPVGPSARVFVACYMLVTGAARIITGNTATGVNVFSARVFGFMLTGSGLMVFLTVLSRYRYRWHGRVSAIMAAVLWVLLIAQAWPAGAWVSISGAFVFVAVLIYEVSVTGPRKPQSYDE